MKIPISFSDMTYTQKGLASLMFPLGISYVASYARKNLGIEAEIFKYPEDLARYLEKKTPEIACFSSYSWNNNLAYGFAERIKRKYPSTIIVFGGPNYPIYEDEQKEYLLSYPAIDFYIQREGEKAFVKLFEVLSENDFNAGKVKREEIAIPSSHYISKGGNLIKGEFLPRLINLDGIPSPYLSGMNDKFFDGILIPMIQTTRGCPFSCTYCQEGNEYFNRIARFSPQRVSDEVEYIAQRIKVPSLSVVDNNFGMYKEDIETARKIATIRSKYGWPKYFDAATGKNNIKRVIDCATLVGGEMNLSASVQSTDPVVLRNIKRNNISTEKMIKLTKTGEELMSSSIGEIILCLPGDSKKAHFKSVSDMIDSDVNIVRAYQLVLLPASEVSDRKSRGKYGMETRFRVIPRCFGDFELYREKFFSAEIDEICVSNNTMSYKDYLECRLFNLTTEIFYNNGIFEEVINFLRINNIPTSKFIYNVHNAASRSTGALSEIYNGFLRENQECLWKNRSDLEKLLQQAYEKDQPNPAESKDNELFKYRGMAFFTRMKDLHEIVFNEAKNLICQKKDLQDDWGNYFSELFEFSFLRKKNILSLDDVEIKVFHYDFIKLLENRFRNNPFSEFRPAGIKIEIAHIDSQKELILKYIEQFGTSPDGLGRILHKTFVNKLYRSAIVIK